MSSQNIICSIEVRLYNNQSNNVLFSITDLTQEDERKEDERKLDRPIPPNDPALPFDVISLELPVPYTIEGTLEVAQNIADHVLNYGGYVTRPTGTGTRGSGLYIHANKSMVPHLRELSEKVKELYPGAKVIYEFIHE
jgi:hypothetical protein